VTLTARPQQSAMPMVAVRSIGLAFESLLGLEVAGQRRTLVSDEYLRVLVYIANERFTENVKRIERFRSALQAASEEGKGTESGTQRPQWEDSASRRERLRSEGLERQKQKQKEKQLAGQRQPAVCAPIEDLRYSIPDV
jgi:tRNA wybutosine-synthesizing protein 3